MTEFKKKGLLLFDCVGEWLSNQVTGSDGLGIVTGFGTSQFQSSVNTTLNRRSLKEVLFRVNSDRR